MGSWRWQETSRCSASSVGKAHGCGQSAGEERPHRLETLPWASGGAHTHNRIPLRTLLTSARGEHDRPADIILVVHVAFD